MNNSLPKSLLSILRKSITIHTKFHVPQILIYRSFPDFISDRSFCANIHVFMSVYLYVYHAWNSDNAYCHWIDHDTYLYKYVKFTQYFVFTQQFSQVLTRSIHSDNRFQSVANLNALAKAMVDVYKFMCSNFSVDDQRHYLFTPRDITAWAFGLTR